MKKYFIISLLALLGFTQGFSQEYEYVPFVREGVKWVYFYDNPFNAEVLGMADSIQYYSFELKEDTVIDSKSYKPVQLSYLTSTGEDIPQEFVPAYLREEDKKVYAILPEGRWYPQCPVGFGFVVSSNPDYSVPADEFVLYDFNDPTSLYDEYEGFFPDYTYTDTIAIGPNHLCKCHHYERDYGPQHEMLIIEGYGYASGGGMPLYYFPTLITGMQVFYHLSHVIEKGKIIYKSEKYNQSDAIDELAADKARQADGNYYNLMGQPMGKQLPTTPGIYIHHGKKICVR